jgi:uncharacterized cupredoxin-like copper-binding protein
LGAVSLLAFLAAFIGWAPSAFAHHPEISGKVGCAEPDGFLVSFLSESWQKSGGDNSGGANPNIAVLYRLRTDGGVPSAWIELPHKPTYLYNDANGYEFEDSFLLPDTSAGDEVQLRARADAKWGNGVESGQITDSDWLYFPTDCDHPGVPKVESHVICVEGDGKATVTVSNTGGDLDVTFVIGDPSGGPNQTIILSPGESQSVTFDGLGDGTVNIPVTADGKDMSQTVNVDCDRPGKPEVYVDVECVYGDGVATVTLENTAGDLPITFVVEGQTVVVDPGEEETVTLSGLADGVVTISITADGKDLSQTVNVDCDRPGKPAVSVNVECVEGDGVATVTLANTGGDLPVTFIVEGQTVIVAPGGSETVTLSDLADGVVDITITADGKDMSQTVNVDCDRPGEPSVSVGLECVEGNGVATVSLANTGGDLPITFVVEGQTVILGPGESDTVVLSGLADGLVTIAITADGKDMSQAVSVDCDRPGVPNVSSTAECVAFDGVVSVVVSNDGGDLPVTFVVTDPRGGTPTTITLNPGESQTVVLSGFADGTWTIPVTADGANFDQVVEIACDHPGTPAVEVKAECVEEGGLVTLLLSNTDPASEPVTFSVADPRGGPPQEVVVAAGATSEVSFGGFEDGDYSFNVVADGTPLPPFVVPVDCEQPAVPTASHDCAAGGYAVVITNEGGTPSTVTVTKNGETVEVVEVPGGGEVTVLVPFAEDETGTVEVLHDGESLYQVETTHDCENPQVLGSSMECDEDGLVVKLDNDGEADAVVIALIDDLEVAQVTVPAGGTADLVVPLEEDEETHVVVSHNGVVLLEDDFTFDCVPENQPPPPTQPPTQVLGNELTQPLPVTGSDMRYGFLGLAFIALGGLLVSVARGRRGAHT